MRKDPVSRTSFPYFHGIFSCTNRVSSTFLAPACVGIAVISIILSVIFLTRLPVELLFLAPVGIASAWCFFRYPDTATLLIIALIPLDVFTVIPGQEDARLSFIKVIAPLALAGTFCQRGRFKIYDMDSIDTMLIVFVAYTCILFPFSIYPAPALQFLIKAGSMLVLYYLVTFWGDHDDRFMRKLTWVLIISTATSSLFAFFSIYVNGNPFSTFQDDTLVRVTGATGVSPNDYAYILFLPLALALGAFLSRLPAKYRILALICLFGIASSLLYTYSRSAIVSGFLSFLVLLGIIWRKLDARMCLIVLFVFVLALLLMPDSVQERMLTLFYSLTGDYQEVSLDRRGNYVQVGLNILAKHPFLGGGLGSFPLHHADPVYQPVPALYGLARMPHNLYLQVGTETGIVGLFFFMTPLAALFYRLRQQLLCMGDLFGSMICAAAMVGLLSSFFMGFFLHLLFNKTFWITLAYCRVLVRNHASPTCYRAFEHRR